MMNDIIIYVKYTPCFSPQSLCSPSLPLSLFQTKQHTHTIRRQTGPRRIDIKSEWLTFDIGATVGDDNEQGEKEGEERGIEKKIV